MEKGQILILDLNKGVWWVELGFEAFFFWGALFWLSANFLRLKNDRFLKIKVELFEDTGGLFEGCAGSF